MPIYILFKICTGFLFYWKIIYRDIFIYREREREIHLRPGRGLNSRPLKPILSEQ